MTDSQITAVVREYAEEMTKDIPRTDDIKSLREYAIQLIAEGMEKHLRWLLRRYCLVEKSKVEEEYHEAKFTCGNVDPRSDTFVSNLAQKSLLERLFPDLGKQEKDADIVIQGWVCRDKEWQKDIFPSDLFLAMEKPKRNEEWKTWTDMGAYIPLNTELFPDLTWESDPEPVEIIIKRKKNG